MTSYQKGKRKADVYESSVEVTQGGVLQRDGGLDRGSSSPASCSACV